MSTSDVRAAYGHRAAEYIELFGSIEAAAEADRDFVLDWARGVDGLILDVGCGPGHWTKYLADDGLLVEGVDPAPEFISSALEQYPGLRFQVGEAAHLPVGDASLGGVLSWYSLIHVEPAQIGATLTDLARSVRADGGLALAFFEGPELTPFDHAVAPAYFWPIDLLAAHVEQAGFVVTDTRTRSDLGARRHGAITARRISAGRDLAPPRRHID